jgi:hypothetical protein
VLVATPPPLVDVTPTREIRTVAPVNEVAVDGKRAATLVGSAQAWEYMLVWSPKGVVVRASLACDTQESNVVLTGNRFAHDCFQSGNFVITGTLKPLHGGVTLRAAAGAQVALAARNGLIAGSIGRAVWRLDRKQKLRTYPRPVFVLAVDGGRILVDRDAAQLDVLSSAGGVIGTIRRAHEGGALMRGGRIATLTGRRLVMSDLHGRTFLTRTIAAGARLEDLDGGLLVYSVETRLHLFRLSDSRDVKLRLRRQFGYAHAHLSSGALFYTYNERTGRLGHAGFLDAARVHALLGG